MQKLFIALCLSASCALHAQQLGVAAHIGYTVGKTDSIKKVMLLNEGMITGSFSIHSNFRVVVGVGGSVVQYASQAEEQQLYHQHAFFLLPLQVQRHWVISSRGNLYMEIGVLSSFAIRNKVELISGGSSGTRLRDARGGSFAFTGAAGYIFQFNKSNSFSLGIGSSQHFLQMRHNVSGQIRQSKRFLALSFHRAFNAPSVVKTFKKI